MPFSEEVALELEALRSVYDDHTAHIIEGPPLEVDFIANPHTTVGNEQLFVQATLRFYAVDDHLSVPPTIKVLSSRGLGEERKQHLLKSLAEYADELGSDVSLLALCETARELLDEINAPEGSCAICMESLMSADNSLDNVMLCPCYHSFHKRCFCEWWNSRQFDLQMEEQEWIRKNGSGCLKMPLPKKHNGAYVLYCPICRAEVTNEEVADVLCGSSDADACQWNGTSVQSLDQILSPEDLGTVRRFQEKWQPQFRSQMERGAFFPESPFVLSLPPCTEASPSENENFR